MYVIDGIAYAGEPVPQITAVAVRSLSDYKLWLRFSTGEERIFDCAPLLKLPAYAPLEDTVAFNSVYVDCGVPTWCDGKIDIAPETVYARSQNAHENA